MQGSERMVLMVFPANVHALWAQVAAILKPAADRVGTHDIEDVRHAIMNGSAQLWVRWGGAVEAAAVTEFKSYPKGLWLNVWLFGARKGMAANETEFEEHLLAFAQENKCTGIRHEGRSGWKKRHAHLAPALRESTVYMCRLSDLKKLLG